MKEKLITPKKGELYSFSAYPPSIDKEFFNILPDPNNEKGMYFQIAVLSNINYVNFKEISLDYTTYKSVLFRKIRLGYSFIEKGTLVTVSVYDWEQCRGI